MSLPGAVGSLTTEVRQSHGQLLSAINQGGDQLREVQGAIGSLTTEVHQSHDELLNAVNQGHNQLMGGLDTVKMLTEAAAHNIAEMKADMKLQTEIVRRVLCYCESIQAGQSDIINNQARILQAIVSTREEVSAGINTILQSMWNARLKDVLASFDLLKRKMEAHLKHPGE